MNSLMKTGRFIRNLVVSATLCCCLFTPLTIIATPPETIPPELAVRPGLGARLSDVLLETIAAIHAVDTAAIATSAVAMSTALTRPRDLPIVRTSC